MKVFLPFVVKDIGGTSTFAAKFKNGMERLGHTVTMEFCEDYDVLFLIVQGPLAYLRHAKRNGKKIVQRLDGVYYWSVAGVKFPLLNAKAALARHFFTDFTIYQSQYSRKAAIKFLGKKRHDRHKIIYNGVNTSLFTPIGKSNKLSDRPGQKVFFSASAFRRRDQLLPVLEALEIYKQKYSDNFKLVLAGSFNKEVVNFPELAKQYPYVQIIGKVKNEKLPEYERAADLFIFAETNPACPNNVIESIACGLPVCGVADGAMPELIEEGKTGLLTPAEGRRHWQKRKFNTARFADNLFTIASNHKQYAKNCRAVAEQRFTLEAMTKAYVNVFEELVR